MFRINSKAKSKRNEDVSFFVEKIIIKTDVEEFIKMMKVLEENVLLEAEKSKMTLKWGLRCFMLVVNGNWWAQNDIFYGLKPFF